MVLLDNDMKIKVVKFIAKTLKKCPISYQGFSKPIGPKGKRSEQKGILIMFCFATSIQTIGNTFYKFQTIWYDLKVLQLYT